MIFFPPLAVVRSLQAEKVEVPFRKALGLIDTGASMTCVDNAIAQVLSLIARDIVKVGTPNGVCDQGLYDASLRLPFPGSADSSPFDIQVLGANLSGQEYQVLIGRDILSHGTLIYNGWDNNYQFCI